MWKLLQVCSLATAAASGNPFASGNYYVNPAYQTELDKSIATATGEAKANMQKMRNIPSAYWIDKKSKIKGTTTDTLEGILMDAAKKPTPPLCVFILYNLPNRDCDSTNSRGEICCYKHVNGTCDLDNSGDCKDGLTEYRTEYVDPFVSVVQQYASKVPIAIIIEPDSLPNLATNLKNPHCANTATNAAYTEGIPYAVNALKHAAPSVSLYLDAAHGGWLGWEDNAQAFASVLGTLNVVNNLRGLSSNVANYQPLGTPCAKEAFDEKMHNYCIANPGQQCCADACNLLSQYSAGNNEYNYIQAMMKELARSIPYWTPHWVIDTGRNGVPDERASCSNWCNARGAGVGHAPTANTSLPDVVDALYWLKTPGESDGCTQTLPDGKSCARFDPMCASADSIGSRTGEPRAPYAGEWFDYQIKQLATNAHFEGVTRTVEHVSSLAGKAAAAPTAFGACEAPAACPEGYACKQAVCMPTEETVKKYAHDSGFATRLEHAAKALMTTVVEA